MLTERQKRIKDFIVGYGARTGGACPSYQEIADFLHLKSKGNVNRFVRALEERGQLRRMPGRRRALEVISPSRPQVIPTVSYPDAQMFVWDDEAKALKPMERKP